MINHTHYQTSDYAGYETDPRILAAIAAVTETEMPISTTYDNAAWQCWADPTPLQHYRIVQYMDEHYPGWDSDAHDLPSWGAGPPLKRPSGKWRLDKVNYTI